MAATASCFLSNMPWKTEILSSTALVGMLGVFCSGMIYHVTQRECWRGELSLGRFFSTAILLGLASLWCALSWANLPATWIAASLVLVTVIKLARELALLRLCPDDANLNEEMPLSPLARSAFLMRFRLGLLSRSRLACAWLGGVILPALSLVSGTPSVGIAATGLILCLTGELAERALFFRAVATVRMPGGVAA
jgi:DMSO reductase anchor subunit